MKKETLPIRTDFETETREDRSICREPSTVNAGRVLEDFTPNALPLSDFSKWEFTRFMAQIDPRAITDMDNEQTEYKAAKWLESSFGTAIRRN